MPKYNLYKIPKENEGALIEKLSETGLGEVGEQNIESFNMKFFFSSQPDAIDIWWAQAYQVFLGGLAETPKNLMHYGALLITTEHICYAISLGKAHFYLSQFCDADFGLDLAERILDENDLKMKNSKYYKSSKSKMITTYQQGSQINFDSGESTHYIKGKTIHPEMYGKVVSFGKSAHFNIPKNPLELPDFINHIENVLIEPIRVILPRVDVVRDRPTMRRLDTVLARSILRTQNQSSLNIEEFTVSGIDFIFSDNHEYSIYLKGRSGEAVHLEELSLQALLRFVNSSNIDLQSQINDLKVKVHNEFGRDHAKPLKFYLDFIEENERYCLIDGVWHKFNQSYVNYLESEVNKIQIEYDESFDISSETIEEEFNQQRVANGYQNFDRSLESLDGRYRVEKMDLYKEGILYFVKKGTPQKLVYVIDQAINTVRILQNNASSISIDGEDIIVNGIGLWMILSRQTRIQSLSEVNSIILHMKLVEWKKVVADAGFVPSVKINYFLSP